MRCIQLGSTVGCSRVPQVHFVRKQTMCKSLYTYLTICFAFEKPRWFLHNTADRVETVFSHLNSVSIGTMALHPLPKEKFLRSAMNIIIEI